MGRCTIVEAAGSVHKLQLERTAGLEEVGTALAAVGNSELAAPSQDTAGRVVQRQVTYTDLEDCRTPGAVLRVHIRSRQEHGLNVSNGQLELHFGCLTTALPVVRCHHPYSHLAGLREKNKTQLDY